MQATIRLLMLMLLGFCWAISSFGYPIPALLLAGLMFMGLAATLPIRAAVFPFIGAFCLAYTIIGIADLSLYRGPLSAPVVQSEVALTLIVAALSLAFTPLRLTRNDRSVFVSINVVYATMAPGLLGAALQLQKGGLDFGQSGRFSNDPLTQLLIESLFIPLLLIGARLKVGQPGRRRQLIALAGMILAILLLTGYRNFVIGGLIVLGLQLNSDRRFLRALPYGVVGVLFFSVIGYLRQAFAPNLLPMDQLRAKYAFSDAIPDILIPLHITARETIGIANTIVTRGLSLDSPVFFGDLLTLLPGKQISGGKVVAELVGSSQSGGLTIGLLGSALVEFGSSRYVFVTAVAATFMLFMRAPWTKNLEKQMIFTSYGAYQFLLTFHTGVLRPGVIITDLMLIFVVTFFVRAPRLDATATDALPVSDNA